FTGFFFHCRPSARLWSDLEIALTNNLAIRLINHEHSVHESDLRNTVPKLRFYISLPKIFGLMHVRISIDDLHSLPHGQVSFAICLKSTLGDSAVECQAGRSAADFGTRLRPLGEGTTK